MAASSERSRGLAAALIFLLSLIAYQGAIVWLDNVHIVTSNGLYKSIQAEPWIASPGTARLDPSNYLYFPLYGMLCRLLDLLGIWRGVPWKQLAVLNSFFAALGTAVVYAFVSELTGKISAAVLAALFHFGCGFVLLLAVISEDIMPGYVCVLAAMSLAALWFDRPTWGRVFIVALLFTLGWLIEWRLLFPLLPALVLALLIAPESIGRRLAMIATLVVSILAVSGVVQLAWDGHNGAVGLHDMLWTGKGVTTGWAGFTLDKAWLMLMGLGNYLLLQVYEPDAGAGRAGAWGLLGSVALQLAIFAVAFAVVWARRGEPRIRAVAAVFLGTFAGGELFNLYSQPQDAQMQINVMPWLTVAWAFVIAAVRAPIAVLALLSAAPLAFNLVSMSSWRGDDTRWLRSLASIEAQAKPEQTVFLYFGFEPVAVWQYALWSRTWDWDGKPHDAKFKWISMVAGAIRHPEWTADQHAAALKRDIDTALDRGHRVMVSRVWEWSPVELSGQLVSLSAMGRAEALHTMLHRNYTAELAFTDPQAGPYYALRRR